MSKLKPIMVAALVAAFFMPMAFAFTVCADETTATSETIAPVESSEPETTETTAPPETAVSVVESEPEDSSFGLTPDGNMTLVDDIKSDEASSMEFLTVNTKDNHTFYIVIEHGKGGDNVHFLNQVDSRDILSLTSDEEVRQYVAMLDKEAAQKEKDNSVLSTILGDETPTPTPTPVPDGQVQKESKGISPLYMLIGVVVVMGLAAGGYYFFKIKPGKNNKYPAEPEFEDDEETEAEPEEEFTEDYYDGGETYE